METIIAESAMFIESAQISQLNRSNGKEVLELIEKYFTISSDKPIESLKGRRSSQVVLEQIERNETINLN